MDLLGELGAFVDASRFLLPSALGRVEALAVALAMLLDVLVLGHLCLLGGAAAASPELFRRRRVRVADCSALPVLLDLTASDGYFCA